MEIVVPIAADNELAALSALNRDTCPIGSVALFLLYSLFCRNFDFFLRYSATFPARRSFD